MSGIDRLKDAAEKDLHTCTACMNAVTQTFSYLREQNKQLRQDKANLLAELTMLRQVQTTQLQVMTDEIKALEVELAILKKKSKSAKNR